MSCSWGSYLTPKGAYGHDAYSGKVADPFDAGSGLVEMGQNHHGHVGRSGLCRSLAYTVRDGQWSLSLEFRAKAQPVDINVIFMRNWDSTLSENNDDAQPTSYAYSSYPSSSKTQPQSPCGWQRDWEMVQKVCAHVGIPEHRIRLVDLSKEYWTRVFEPALSVWENGGTPNPDVACNREIKFGALMRHIPKAARSFLATGEYPIGVD